MLRGGPEPSGFLSIRSCSLVFFSSSDKLLLARICLLFTASSFTSFRKLALWEDEDEEEKRREAPSVNHQMLHQMFQVNRFT